MAGCKFKATALARFSQLLGGFVLSEPRFEGARPLSKGGHRFTCCGIGGAFTSVVRLLTRIDERAQLDWSGSLHGNRGLLQVRTGGNPIELHLLCVPKAKYRGVALKRGAPGAAVTVEGKLGIKKVGKIAGLSKFKRSAMRRRVLGPLMRNSSLLQFDRATLRTAWKYVYLFPAYRRLTRYVE